MQTFITYYLFLTNFGTCVWSSHTYSQNMMHFVAFLLSTTICRVKKSLLSLNQQKKTGIKTWFLSSFEPDYNYLFNSQTMFTCMNDSEESILCLILLSTFFTNFQIVNYYTFRLLFVILKIFSHILWKKTVCDVKIYKYFLNSPS